MIIIFFIIGIAIGFGVSKAISIYNERKYVASGEFIINTEDPYADLYRLVLTEDIETLATKKKIVLTNTVLINSQK